MPERITVAHIGLGSNLGDRAAHLRQACAALKRLAAPGSMADWQPSSVYQSGPVDGPPGQPEYFNAAIALPTGLSPRELLSRLQDLERRAGRTREVPMGPRTLDLDLLLFGDRVVCTDDLRVPHPRLHQRRFVLEPLAEIAAAVVHPVLGLTIGDLRAQARAIYAAQTVVRLAIPLDETL